MRMRDWVVGVLFSLLLVGEAGATVSIDQSGSFSSDARELRKSESWSELLALSEAEIESEPQEAVVLAYLSLARAGMKDFDGSVAALVSMRESGADPSDGLAGFGIPLEATLNGIYSHCWADFSAETNRACWQEFYSEFGDSHYAQVPASRLLMAALKLDDEAEARRVADWFDVEVAAAREAGDPVTSLLGYYGKAYILAGRGGPEVVALCNEAYQLRWEAAIAKHGYDPDAEVPDLALRELCDLDCDSAYNDLALASHLSGDSDPATNLLAAREPQPTATFEDVTEEFGLSGVKQSRIAIGDYNQDGWPDLCFQGRLFRNLKGKGFEDVTAASGLVVGGTAALFADYDGDGYLDILVANSPHPRLYRNLGKREKYGFEDVTAAAGLGALKLAASPEGVAWFDYDGDGWLDIYLAIYENPSGTGHADILLRNQGDGSFAEVSDEAGVSAAGAFCGRGVAACDYDQDGDTDLYVSDYRLQENLFFVNDGNGKLEDQSAEKGLKGVREPADGQYFGHTIGSCWGDIDNDGDMDLYTANLAHPRFVAQGFSNLSMLYINGGAESDWSFSEERRARGIRFQETMSDPAFVDFDNDGDLDLSITCVYEAVPSALYQNDGAGNFTPVTFRAQAEVFHGWGQAWFDFDNDGDLDLLVASSAGCRLLQNSGNANHWLKIDLEGKRPNRLGVGARVRLTTIDEEQPRSWTRELSVGRGTSSQDGTTLHFGLGDFSGRVAIEVYWPGVSKPQKRNSRVDRLVEFRQR